MSVASATDIVGTPADGMGRSLIRILFIDDSSDDVLLASNELRHRGLEFEERLATNIVELRKALAEGGWSAIVSDYNLGGLAGLDALKMVRERDPDVPFIVLSGTIGEERAAEAIREGANDYVTKDGIGRLPGALRRELAAAESRAAKRRLEARLRNAEERYRRTFEQAPVGIGNATTDGRFLSVNARLCEILGYAEREIVGRRFTDFLHPEDVSNALAVHQSLLGRISRTPAHVDRRYLRKDGSTVWATVTLSGVLDSGGELDSLVGIVQDITAQKAAHEKLLKELRRRTLQQSAIANLGQIGLSGASIAFLLDQAIAAVRSVLAFDAAGVLQSAGEDLVLTAGYGWNDAGRGTTEGEHRRRRRGNAELVLVPRDANAQAEFTLKSGRSMVVTDAATETRLQVPAESICNGLVSGITVPIHGGDGTPWGVLAGHSRSARTYAPYDVEFLRSVASVMGQALERDATDVELRRRARQQSAIAELGRLVLTSFDTGVFERACELLISGTRAEYGFVSELTPRKTLRAIAGRIWSKDLPAEIAATPNTQEGTTILSGVPVVVEDYRTETRFDTYGVTVPHGILSGVSAPIASARRSYGVLCALSRHVNHFRQEDVDFIQSLANMLAEAIERDNARHDVEESEQRYRRIFGGATEVIFTVDEAGRFAALNPAFTAITGWAADEWLGLPFESLTAPEDRPRLRALFARVLSEQISANAEIALLGKGRRVIVELTCFPKVDNGAVSEVYGFARDVTEARRAAAGRERVTRSLELLLESTAEGIYTVDLEGRCTMINRAAASFLGMAPDDVKGCDVHELLHAAKPIEHGPVHDVLRTGQPRTVSGDTFSRKDGSPIPVAYSAAPIFDEGALVGAVVSFTDLSERRKLEAKLEQAERLSSLGRLAATVAHEFNNVLMGIAPFVEVIRRSPAPQKVATALDHIGGSVKRGQRITEDILRFTQPAEPIRTCVDVDVWLKAIAVETRSLLGPKYDVTVDSDRVRVEADPNQMHQIFMNLMFNARDAMPGGGAISMVACQERADARFPFGVVENPSRYVHLIVTDTGCGMSEETLRHAFEPLFTTKRNGTGLGLAVTHQVIRRHDGEIFIESTPGAGTAFHLFLPLPAGDEAEMPEGAGERPFDHSAACEEVGS